MIGDILTVWERDGSRIECAAGFLDQLEGAMHLYVGESGAEFNARCEHDTVLRLGTLAGEPYRVLASQITSWKLSTRESRARSRELEAQLAAEAIEDHEARQRADEQSPQLVADSVDT